MLTPAELNDLTVYHRVTISQEHLDSMGHMNIRWYVAIFDDATWKLFEQLGMDAAYSTEKHAGMFALRQFIQYIAEIHAGQTVAVRSRLIGRSEKRLHFMHFMVNESTDTLASTIETLGTHADLDTRKSSPFLPEMATCIDDMLAKHQALLWQPPLSGAIKL